MGVGKVWTLGVVVVLVIAGDFQMGIIIWGFRGDLGMEQGEPGGDLRDRA
jgi:hypothetical protein